MSTILSHQHLDLRLSTFDLRPSTSDLRPKFMFHLRIITLIAISVLFIAACDTVDSFDSAELSKEQLEEAYHFALWYTGDLQPSDADVQSAARTLAQIRTRYGNRSEFIRDSSFMTPWVPGQISLEVTEEARAEYDAQGSWPWEAESDLPQPESYRTYNFSQVHVGLTFEEQFHPGRLCSLYLERGYVENCHANFYGHFGHSRFSFLSKVVSDQIRWFIFQSPTFVGPGSEEVHLIIESNGALIYKKNPDDIDFWELNNGFYHWQIP